MKTGQLIQFQSREIRALNKRIQHVQTVTKELKNKRTTIKNLRDQLKRDSRKVA